MQRLVQKRRKLGLTNYPKRLKLLKSGLPRLIVRPTNRGIVIEIAEFDPIGDKILLTVTEKNLAKIDSALDGNTVPICYLTGYLAGLKAKKLKLKEAVLDTGRYNIIKGGRIAAALKGFTDSGIKVPHDKSIFPDKKRLDGTHLKKKLPDTLQNLKAKLEAN